MSELIHQQDAPTISDMVRADFRTASVFKRYGLDFCCGGKTTVDKACLAKGINTAEVEAALAQAVETLPPAQDFDSWPLDELAAHIVATHHSYVTRALPELEAYFHYRNLDVSTVKELCRRWAPSLARGLTKRSTHRALQDVEDSIAELRYYREHFLLVR